MSEGPEPKAKRPVLLRVFWGSVRALSLFFCAGGVLLLAVGLLNLLDILEVPFVKVELSGDEYPDYRRETVIIGLLMGQLSLWLGASLYRAWSAHGKHQLGACRVCPHCGKPLP